MSINDPVRETIMRRIICSILFLMLLYSFPSTVLADGIFPEGLLSIEEEAFAGDVSLENVTIPGHVTSIGTRAFAETALRTIVIPSSVTDIAGDAFENITSPMLIVTEADSSAVTYALSNNLDFRADTVCRALVIGQTDYPGAYKIDGPGKDIMKIQTVLDGYSVSTLTNLTSEGILDAIISTFSDAEDEDISLFYYCGHGYRADGSLVGIDITSRVTASELRIALDSVPGRKIVIIDACYSGALIGRSILNGDGSSTEPVDPAKLFLSAFIGGRSRTSSTLAAQQYFVIASSKGNEDSWEAAYGGIFTDAFIKTKTFGDEDADGVVTLQEAYHYTKDAVMEVANAGGKTQSVQVYPENCNWFGLFR